MKNKTDSSLLSQFYSRQEDHHNKYSIDPDKIKHSELWLEENSIDSWRHQRMYRMLDTFLKSDKGSAWLTVGDGRYGKEAMYIGRHNGKVLATDLSDALLKIAKKKGLIRDYKKENAENLSFKDSSFDYVFCKESLHHFPRPMIALYEMLRVAKKAVILIEPHDTSNIVESLLIKLLRESSNLSLVGGYFNSYEESGNYVYKISEREIEKIALGINIPYLAFHGLDDYYESGVEKIKADNTSLLFMKIKLVLAVLKIFYKLGLRQRSLLVAVLFKKEPVRELREELFKNGFNLIRLSRNPYIK